MNKMDEFTLLEGKNQKKEQYEFLKSNVINDIINIHKNFEIKDIKYELSHEEIGGGEDIFFVEVEIDTKLDINPRYLKSFHEQDEGEPIEEGSFYMDMGNNHYYFTFSLGCSCSYGDGDTAFDTKLQEYKSKFTYIYEPVLNYVKENIDNLEVQYNIESDTDTDEKNIKRMNPKLLKMKKILNDSDTSESEDDKVIQMKKESDTSDDDVYRFKGTLDYSPTTITNTNYIKPSISYSRPKFYGFISNKDIFGCNALTNKGKQCKFVANKDVFVNNNKYRLCSLHYNIYINSKK